MEPIGLTYKNLEINPFTGRKTGEIMIVHRCVSCGRITNNRIAGDDNPFVITDLLQCNEVINGIIFLTQKDEDDIHRILYGY